MLVYILRHGNSRVLREPQLRAMAARYFAIAAAVPVLDRPKDRVRT